MNSVSIFWGLGGVFTTRSVFLSSLTDTLYLEWFDCSLSCTPWLRPGEWIHLFTKSRTGNTTTLAPPSWIITVCTGLWLNWSNRTRWSILEGRGGWGAILSTTSTITRIWADRMGSSMRILETFRLKKTSLYPDLAAKKENTVSL